MRCPCDQPECLSTKSSTNCERKLDMVDHRLSEKRR